MKYIFANTDKMSDTENRQYYILSWNVNGYKSKIHCWLLDFVAENSPDIIFLSETKKSEKKLERWLSEFENYSHILNVHNPSHHHGVIMMIKKDISLSQEKVNLNIPCRNDNRGTDPVDGRIISVFLKDLKLLLVGTYVPNSAVNRDREKYDYRVNVWDPALQQYLTECDNRHPTIWFGDINVAPTEDDVSGPGWMNKYPGFTDRERVSLVKFLSDRWVDVWRVQHLDVRLYSWRNPSKGDNSQYGMRLDNFIVSKRLFQHVTNTFMVSDCPLSDHVPIGIILK